LIPKLKISLTEAVQSERDRRPRATRLLGPRTTGGDRDRDRDRDNGDPKGDRDLRPVDADSCIYVYAT
jgi:hypothetical protein